MRNKRRIAAACLACMLALTACSTSKSLTFQVEDGGKVKVTLETGDGYNLSSEDGETLWLYVRKDDDTVLEGILLTEEGYEEYARMISAADEVDIVRSEPEDAPVFFAYQWESEDGTKTDFLFQIEGSLCAGLFESSAPYEEAEAAFSRLSFEAVE